MQRTMDRMRFHNPNALNGLFKQIYYYLKMYVFHHSMRNLDEKRLCNSSFNRGLMEETQLIMTILWAIGKNERIVEAAIEQIL